MKKIYTPFLYSSRENGKRTFSSEIAIQVTFICETLLKPLLKDAVFNSFSGFICQGEHKDNDDGLIDFAISLLGHNGSTFLPLLYVEEKADAAKAKQASEQTNRYFQALFRDWKDLDQWLHCYKSMCCIIVNQEDKTLRFLRYSKSINSNQGVEDLIKYTNPLGLFKPRTVNFDRKEVSYAVELLVKNVYSQLDEMGLFCPDKVAKVYKV